MEYYQKLKEARIKAGLSQAEAGEKIGTSQRQVSKYEQGINEMTISRFKELCILYQVSADEMLELNKYKPL